MVDLPTLGLVITSALIDSINPCAIGVLILMVSVVLGTGKSTKRLLLLGGAYILAIFTTYLVAGLGLVYFFSEVPIVIAEYLSIAVAMLVIADKAVSKMTTEASMSLNVTFTDVKGYPGKDGNFVTCYELSGDWHDKYAIVGANGTFNGAWQIPMADLTRV